VCLRTSDWLASHFGIPTSGELHNRWTSPFYGIDIDIIEVKLSDLRK
jgi:hypothetical protein